MAPALDRVAQLLDEGDDFEMPGLSVTKYGGSLMVSDTDSPRMLYPPDSPDGAIGYFRVATAADTDLLIRTTVGLAYLAGLPHLLPDDMRLRAVPPAEIA